jgi:hypothetical protein
MTMQPPAAPPLRPAAQPAAQGPSPQSYAAAAQSWPKTIAGIPMPVAIGVAVALLVGAGVFFFMQSQDQAQVAAAPPGVVQPVSPSGAPQTAPQTQQQIQSMTQFAPQQQQIQPPTGMSMEQYTQHVQARLAQVQQTMLSQGWQAVGAPHNSQLNNGATENVPAQLMQGVHYRIVGVCDQDCGDMDLRLRDAGNNSLAENTATDNVPVLDVIPAMSGNYTLDVIMYSCSNQPCFYSVALFGRMDGQ